MFTQEGRWLRQQGRWRGGGGSSSGNRGVQARGLTQEPGVIKQVACPDLGKRGALSKANMVGGGGDMTRAIGVVNHCSGNRGEEDREYR